jgi:hypothetical protein
MHAGNSRTFQIVAADRRHQLLQTVESVLPRSAAYAETLAAYLLIVAFWGLILYVALVSALPQ